MKYLITEDQINEWIGNVLTANHKMELKPIEPLSEVAVYRLIKPAEGIDSVAFLDSQLAALRK